jgi:hypothetical protein
LMLMSTTTTATGGVVLSSVSWLLCSWDAIMPVCRTERTRHTAGMAAALLLCRNPWLRAFVLGANDGLVGSFAAVSPAIPQQECSRCWCH